MHVFTNPVTNVTSNISHQVATQLCMLQITMQVHSYVYCIYIVMRDAVVQPV